MSRKSNLNTYMQSDRYTKDESVVTCLITSHEVGVTGADYRVDIKKTETNGLKVDSFVMIDKIVAIPRRKLVKRIGVVESEKMQEIYVRVMDFLAE